MLDGLAGMLVDETEARLDLDLGEGGVVDHAYQLVVLSIHGRLHEIYTVGTGAYSELRLGLWVKELLFSF